MTKPGEQDTPGSAAPGDIETPGVAVQGVIHNPGPAPGEQDTPGFAAGMARVFELDGSDTALAANPAALQSSLTSPDFMF